MTTAQTIGALLGDDGASWMTGDCRTFVALCREARGIPEAARDLASLRWVFPDGSVIVERGDGWDLATA